MIVYDENCSDHSKSRWESGIRMNFESGNHIVEIDEDRYGGAYSDHGFTAWKDRRPDDIDAGDPTCEEFWSKWKDKAVYGGGETPQDAFRDLIEKIDQVGIYLGDEENPKNAPLKVVMFYGSQGIVPFVYDSNEFREWLKQDGPKTTPRPFVVGYPKEIDFTTSQVQYEITDPTSGVVSNYNLDYSKWDSPYTGESSGNTVKPNLTITTIK